MRQALEDSQISPERPHQLRRNQRIGLRAGDMHAEACIACIREDAHDFLMGERSSWWLDLLGVNPKVFRKRLKEHDVRL